MTDTRWKNAGSAPASLDARSLSVRAFFTLLLSVCLGSLSRADEPSQPPRFPSSSVRSTLDVEIEARVLRALRRDSELGPLNLGVHMNDGVAKLSGPIPAVELKARAAWVVQAIEGVRAVSTKDLYTSSAASPRNRTAIIIRNDKPTQTRSASPHSPSNLSDPPSDPVASQRRLPERTASKGATRTETGPQISVFAPEVAAPPKRGPEAASLMGNPRPAPSGASLASAIEQIRRNDPRYQQIRARVESETVYISPGDTTSEDAMLFAQSIRRLPGVRHVVMEPSSR